MSGAAGLWMLPATALLMTASGLPAWIVLLTVSMVFSMAGILFGFFQTSLLYAMQSRLLGLMENDLLQALPLYVFTGALLNRLPLTDTLFRVVSRLLYRTPAAPYLAALGLGALLAPMNGSVGASVSMLSRAVQPQLDRGGVPPQRSAALICAASTIGVVVPPSLVLILLGDAMMRAHTESLNLSGRSARVINTQDIFHGALVPAATMLVLFLAVTWWRNREKSGSTETSNTASSTSNRIKKRLKTPGPGAISTGDWLTAAAAVGLIFALLIAVTLGLLYAVEGAASAGLALLVFGILSRSLTPAVFKKVLNDTLAISGSLFALLVAASMFTLVLRAFEVDVWVSHFLAQLPGGGQAALAVVLLTLLVSAFVLDAFEITFAVIPVVMPPLLMLVPDAIWVAVLTLLVLQTSYLLPPFGYSVLMVSSIYKKKLHSGKLASALMPYLLVQVALVATVIACPQLVWHSHPAASESAGDSAALTEQQVEQLLEQQRLESSQQSQ